MKHGMIFFILSPGEYIRKSPLLFVFCLLSNNSMSSLGTFLKKSKKPEIYPLIGSLTCALGGAAYVGVHAAKAPDVAWNHKTNPYPWQDIKDGEQVKLVALNQKYNNRWERTKW